jgi:hypothetical protein
MGHGSPPSAWRPNSSTHPGQSGTLRDPGGSPQRAWPKLISKLETRLAHADREADTLRARIATEKEKFARLKAAQQRQKEE